MRHASPGGNMTEIVRQGLVPVVEMAKAVSSEADAGRVKKTRQIREILVAASVVSGEAPYPSFARRRRFP
jgi:hypothetical protein